MTMFHVYNIIIYGSQDHCGGYKGAQWAIRSLEEAVHTRRAAQQPRPFKGTQVPSVPLETLMADIRARTRH